MARPPMPAPQMIETPAMRRSAALAKALEDLRAPPQQIGGYGDLGARLLAQGITKWAGGKAEKTAREENAARLASQAETGNMTLARLLGDPQPAPEAAAPMAAAPAQAAPASLEDALLSAPQPQVPQPQPAPQSAPRNPLGVTPGEAAMIQRALSSGDPGQIAWAQGVLGEIETRQSAPPEWKDITINGVPYLRDQYGNTRAAFPDGLPQEAMTRDEFNPVGTRAGTLGQRDPFGRLNILDEPPEGFEAAGGRLQPIAGGPQDPSSGSNRITNERDLRREFETTTAEYRTVRQAFMKVESSLAQQTGIGDVGGIFGTMKIFDPPSTVREGEFATAQNAGGVPERIRGLYNQVLNGQRLTPQQRDEMIAVARAQYGTYEQGYQGRVADYSRMAEGYGIDPRNVVGGDNAPAPRPQPRNRPVAPSRPRAAQPSNNNDPLGLR